MANGQPDQALSWAGRGAVRVEGELVVLREKRLEDAEDDYSWRADPELATYDAVLPLRVSISDYLIVFKEELRYPSPRQRTLAVEDRQSGRHIGNVMYYDVDERRGQAELGIMIGVRDYWSKGYGTDAIKTMLRYIFQNSSLKRVYLHTLKWNVRAQKSFLKAGFTAIGEVQRNGQDFVHMEIFREQFLAEGAPKPASPDTAHTTQELGGF